MDILFKGLRGSWLHGNSGPGSDNDYFVVFNHEGSNIKTWRATKPGADTSYRGIAYFLRRLGMCSLQTIEIMHAKDYKASPDFQRLILDRRTDFEDTEALMASYNAHMAMERKIGDHKATLSAIYYQNFIVNYFRHGTVDVRIGRGHPFFEEYQSYKASGRMWQQSHRLKYLDKCERKVLDLLKETDFHKKRNNAALAEAVNFFLTPEEKRLYIDTMSNKQQETL